MDDRPRDGRAPAFGLSASVDVHTNERRLVLHGELDLAARPQVDAALRRLLSEGVTSIVVDLGSVTFADCAGLDALIRAVRMAPRLGGAVRVEHPTPRVSRILRLTGLESQLGLGPARP